MQNMMALLMRRVMSLMMEAWHCHNSDDPSTMKMVPYAMSLELLLLTILMIWGTMLNEELTAAVSATAVLMAATAGISGSSGKRVEMLYNTCMPHFLQAVRHADAVPLAYYPDAVYPPRDG